MRVLFLDVGQGTCQIILIGGQRAIVIDTGSHPNTVLRALQLFRIQQIELLCVSHSHSDHFGGAAFALAKSKRQSSSPSATLGILAAYQGAIKKIAYVQDSEFKGSPFGRFLVELIRKKVLQVEQCMAIEASVHPKALWQSVDKKTKLVVISPFGGTTIEALEANKPNASSAIIELRHRGEKIVFAADSEYSAWRDVIRLRTNRPVECRILTMPHHGGLMDGSVEDLEWFQSKAVKPEVVIVSVGTRNKHRHPHEEAIMAMTQIGSHVCCTQITGKCCANLEAIRPGVIGPILNPSRSQTKKDGRNKTVDKKKRGQNVFVSGNVACAGTIVANLDDSGIRVERLSEHSSGVDRLVVGGNSPMCRK